MTADWLRSWCLTSWGGSILTEGAVSSRYGAGGTTPVPRTRSFGGKLFHKSEQLVRVGIYCPVLDSPVRESDCTDRCFGQPGLGLTQSCLACVFLEKILIPVAE